VIRLHTPRRLLIAAILLGGVSSVLAQATSPLIKADAIVRAEQFVASNGYTHAPPEQISPNLTPESLEWTNDRAKRLAQRFGTLNPKAIGIRRGNLKSSSGWSVCFDYVGGGPGSNTCRVVTMDDAGGHLAVEHVDGLRSYFAGFD